MALLQWLAAISGAVAFLYSLMLPLPHSLAARLPSFPFLWCFLACHVWLWHSLGRWLKAWCARRAAIWLGLLAMSALTTLVWSEPLMAVFPGQREAIWTILGYVNPWLLAAACFPGYDVVRDTSLYTLSSLANYHGPLPYPNAHYACFLYPALSLLLNVAARRSNKMTSQARVAQGKNKIHQPA